jgi:membrane protease YdiL (CAAX protease family)
MNEPTPPPLPSAHDVTEGSQSPNAIPEGPSFHERFPFPSWLEVGLMPTAFLVLQVLIGTVGAVVLIIMCALTKTSIHDHMAWLFLGSVVAMVPVLGWGWWRSRLPFAEAFGFRRVSVGVLVAIVPFSIGGNFLLSEFNNLQQSLLPLPNFFEGLFLDLFNSPVMGFVVLAVIAPLTEEPLFRGLILGGLARRKRLRTSVLASAVAFSLMHCNPVQMPSALALGLVYAWIFVWTRSLWPCLLAHAVHNGIGHIVTHALQMEVRGYNVQIEPWVFQPAWFNATGIGLVVLGVVGIFLSHRPSVPGDFVASSTEGD